MKKLFTIFLLLYTFSAFPDEPVQDRDSNSTFLCSIICCPDIIIAATSIGIVAGGYIGWRSGLTSYTSYILSQQLLNRIALFIIYSVRSAAIYSGQMLIRLRIIPIETAVSFFQETGNPLMFLVAETLARAVGASVCATATAVFIIGSHRFLMKILERLVEENCSCDSY